MPTKTMKTKSVDVTVLEEKALWCRRTFLDMAVRADSGHVSTACSQTELLIALYYGGILKHNPKDPHDPDRDIFILSKGQGGLGLYPILADRGFFPVDDLKNFAQRGSRMGVHAENHLPGVEILSGSLGHGLPIATGFAQGFRNDRKDNLVFCLTGDGELHEGSNWEALMFASWQLYGNLVVIVDRNGQCTLGKTDEKESPRDGVGLDPLDEKFKSFGFDVIECDGHNFKDIFGAFSGVRLRSKIGPPLCIIAHTKKGKGLSPIEDLRKWHYKVPSGKDLVQCWEDLGVPEKDRPVKSDNQVKHTLGMRDRFFNALYEHFKKDPNMIFLAADNGAPSLEQFIDNLPGQYLNVGIAEQQMIGMAAGLAMTGKKVWTYAIAPFVTARVFEQVRLDVCAQNLPVAMIGVGASFAYSIMLPSHHSDIDVSIMRCLPNLQVFCPADGVTAAAIGNISANLNAPHYVRMDRGGVPDIYPEQGVDYTQGMYKLRVGNSPLTFISTGIMTHQCLKVAEKYDASVIDIYRIKPFNIPLLLEMLAGCDRIVTVEEHQKAGGLSSLIAETLADENIFLPHLRIGVNDVFCFILGGREEEIWPEYGFDVEGISKSIEQWRSK